MDFEETQMIMKEKQRSCSCGSSDIVTLPAREKKGSECIVAGI